MKHLEVILKVSERCNIDCSYCYFFYGGDESYKQHPPLFSQEKVGQLSKFLIQAVSDFDLESIQVDFHGGEPLLMGERRMRIACETLTAALSGKCSLSFAIQTNGLLINSKWCDLFCDFGFYVGVSLDGDRADNDRFRLDHNGKGTYSRAVRGLEMVLSRSDKELLPQPTVLSVANVSIDPVSTFYHFVEELGIRNIDFLMPDDTHDSQELQDTELLSEWYKKIFDSWIDKNDPSVSIRFLKSLTSLLVGGQSLVVGTGEAPIFAITIGSDGGIHPDDTLRSCGSELFQSDLNISTNSLKDFLVDEKQIQIIEETSALSEKCESCTWSLVCGGGSPVNRWSKENRFDNPTVYCATMMSLIPHIKHRIDIEKSRAK